MTESERMFLRLGNSLLDSPNEQQRRRNEVVRQATIERASLTCKVSWELAAKPPRCFRGARVASSSHRREVAGVAAEDIIRHVNFETEVGKWLLAWLPEMAA